MRTFSERRDGVPGWWRRLLAPIRPLVRPWLPYAAERQRLAQDVATMRIEAAQREERRLAVAAECERQRDEIAALRIEIERRDGEIRRRADQAEFDRDMSAARLRYVQDRLAPERDDLIAQRDGLEAVLADETLEIDRRAGAYERAILRDGLPHVTAVLERLHGRSAHLAIAARGLALCRWLAGPGLLERLERAAAPDGIPRLRLPLRWRAPAGDKIVLVFMGAATRFWSHNMLQFQMLEPFGQHIMFLQDSRAQAFMSGIDGLRAGYDNSLADLRAACAELGGLPIYCIGNSMGGFAALRYGLDLDARAVLAFSTRTSIAANVEPVRADEVLMREALGEGAIDLKPLYAARSVIPRVTLYYGALNGPDMRHAERFADLPGARVIALADYAGHDSRGHLIAQRKLEGVLAEFLQG